MKKVNKSLSLVFLASLTLTSCNNIPGEWDEGVNWSKADPSETTYLSLSGEARKSEVRTSYAYMPTSWNTATTFHAEDAYYLSNVVDGLIEVNEYNQIVPALAKRVPSLDNGDIKVVQNSRGEEAYQITVELKDDVHWVENKGFGKNKVELVKAQDFVTALQITLNYANAAESSYLPAMMIDGADDYFNTTYFMTAWSSVPEKDKGGATNAKEFAALNMFGDKSKVNEINEILTFSKVGVKAQDNKVVYTLQGKFDYFLSVLTYTPFLPVPTDFYNANLGKFGTQPKYMLSNGAYVVDTKYKQGVSREVILNKNLNYHDKENVYNGRVVVMQTPEEADYTTGRKLFEDESVDAFTVNPADQSGWETYVTGKDGKGNLYNPAHENATSIDSPGEGSTMSYNLNTYRTYYKGSLFDTSAPNTYTLSQAGNDLTLVNDPLAADPTKEQLPAALVNTNLALSYSPKIRQAILTALDYSTYWVWSSKAYDSYQDRRLNVNTFTPHGFIKTDRAATNGGTDYVDFLEEAWIDNEVLGQTLVLEGGTEVQETFAASKNCKTLKELKASSDEEAKAYADTLIKAAQELFSPGSMGLYNFIPTAKDGKFTGFAVASTELGHYTTSIGKSSTDATLTGKGDGSAISGLSIEGENEVWYKSRSRDTEYLSKLIDEGIKEANENIKAAGIDWTVKTPIIIDAPGLQWDDTNTKDTAAFLNRTNANLNGGRWIADVGDDDAIAPKQYRNVGKPADANEIAATDAKIYINQSTKDLIPDSATYSTVNSTYNCTLLASGWIPDYSDPKTYAGTVATNGDLSGLIGASTRNGAEKNEQRVANHVVGEYQDLYELADEQVGSGNRAEAFADAEISLLFDNYLLRPLYNRGQGRSVSVRRTLPKGATTLAWGLSSTKLKGLQAFDRILTKQEVKGVYDQITAIRNRA